jgi:ribosomal protein S27AE
MEQQQSKVICNKCGVEPELRKTLFDYLSNTFSHEVPVCPKCGKVFISKELALGKMSEVEKQLEDK